MLPLWFFHPRVGEGLVFLLFSTPPTPQCRAPKLELVDGWVPGTCLSCEMERRLLAGVGGRVLWIPLGAPDGGRGGAGLGVWTAEVLVMKTPLGLPE